MFWRLENRQRVIVSGMNGHAVPYLIVNRAQIAEGGCSACGGKLSVTHSGERALAAGVGPNNSTYMFCAECGDFIMGRVQSGSVNQRYLWDWAIPLRGNVRSIVAG